jgi:hypothetical protein
MRKIWYDLARTQGIDITYFDGTVTLLKVSKYGLTGIIIMIFGNLTMLEEI